MEAWDSEVNFVHVGAQRIQEDIKNSGKPPISNGWFSMLGSRRWRGSGRGWRDAMLTGEASNGIGPNQKTQNPSKEGDRRRRRRWGRNDETRHIFGFTGKTGWGGGVPGLAQAVAALVPGGSGGGGIGVGSQSPTAAAQRSSRGEAEAEGVTTNGKKKRTATAYGNWKTEVGSRSRWQVSPCQVRLAFVFFVGFSDSVTFGRARPEGSIFFSILSKRVCILLIYFKISRHIKFYDTYIKNLSSSLILNRENFSLPAPNLSAFGSRYKVWGPNPINPRPEHVLRINPEPSQQPPFRREGTPIYLIMRGGPGG